MHHVEQVGGRGVIDVGDGHGIPENNNRNCFFDGGDCCGFNVTTDYCTECHCHCNVSFNLIENGVCNDEANIPECNFDGGDYECSLFKG